ncbi:MAG TPA: hypothetical protein VKB17_09075 [Thermoleophilaceae bacterium]|nr:hypothetical protein [Thermoleophilaceae bacterium]
MSKVWVLDTETKGTGAHVVPLEKTQPEPAPKRRRVAPKAASEPRPPRKPRPPTETKSGALPAGHVRKKATGELGRVRSVDPKAGTATVLWLRHGTTSTLPLTAVSRR